MQNKVHQTKNAQQRTIQNYIFFINEYYLKVCKQRKYRYIILLFYGYFF